MSQKPNSATGLARSASLLRALGASAAPVWAELDPEDAKAIAREMDADPSTETADSGLTRQTYSAQSRLGIWERLSELPTGTLGRLLKDEHPQVIALTLSRIAPQAAAALVRQAPALLATDVLHRMLHMAPAHSGAVKAIERAFEDRLAAETGAINHTPDEAVARIFDALPPEAGESLLAELQKRDAGAGNRVRALMFTFDDLATLGPGALQTLLSRADRAMLTLALKGTSGPVREALFANMTARAREVLSEEIAGLGPKSRMDVERARAGLVALARALMDAGEIRHAVKDHDTDLIE